MLYDSNNANNCSIKSIVVHTITMEIIIESVGVMNIAHYSHFFVLSFALIRGQLNASHTIN